MNEDTAEKLRHHILDALDRHPFLQREGDCFFYEIYADYRDGMDSATATKLLSGDDPMQSFWESLEEWYRLRVSAERRTGAGCPVRAHLRRWAISRWIHSGGNRAVL